MDDLAEAYGLGTWLCPIVKSGMEGTGSALLFSSLSDWGGQQGFSLPLSLRPTLLGLPTQ